MGRKAFPLEETAAENAERISIIAKRIAEVNKKYLSDKERDSLLEASKTLVDGLLKINRRYFKLPI